MATPVRFRNKWRIRWVDSSGRRRSAMFTDHKRAAHALRLRQVEAEEIRSGIRTAAPQDRAFSELCDYWLANRTPKKRSSSDDRSIIERHLRPGFGALRLRDVGPERVDAFTKTRAHLDPKTIHNHLTMLIAMLNAAKEMGWVLTVPRIRKPEIRVLDADYRYLRNGEEIERLLEAAIHEPDPTVHPLYATAVFTGMRAGELAMLRWDDVDFETRLIAVTKSFNGPTKSNVGRHVPILDPLLPILQAHRISNPLPVVFPNRAGNSHGESARIFQETLHRVLERAGFPKIEEKQKLVPYITFHDLRHTFASNWMMRGGDIFRLQRILGHASIAMTLRYSHLAVDAFRDDYARLGATSEPVVTP